MTLGNGTTRKYQFDNRGQLATQIEMSGATNVFTTVDGYDPVGNRVTRNFDGNTVTRTYDDLYRLTGQVKSGQVATYTLDGVGNLKTMWEGGSFPKTFTHDAADKITTMIEGADLTTYTWTGYGALATEVTGSATTAYSYSGQDQLVGITDTGGVQSTYTFDGNGLRRTAQNGNVLPTTMVWDGSDYLLLQGPSSNTVILTVGSEIVSSGDFDLLPDSLGSVIGDIRAGFDPRVNFDYWPYGKVGEASIKPPYPFLYVGSLGYYQDNARLYYVRARELDKLLGRWLQTDPLWPEAEAFKYVAVAPTVFNDPSGLWCYGHSGGPLPELINKYGNPPSRGILNMLFRNPVAWQAFLDCISSCASQFPQNLGPPEELMGGLPTNAGPGCTKDFEIIWAEGGWWPFTNKCNDASVCMWTDLRSVPPRIHICQKQALVESKCGPLHCQLAHELLHAIGFSHPGGDQAFNCVRKLPGCESYRPSNVKHSGDEGSLLGR